MSPIPSYSPSSALSALSPRPPGTDAPPTCEVPHFAPVRVGGGCHRLRRLVRHRRRAVAAGLAVTAAALVAAGPHPGAGAQDAQRARGHPATATDRVRERHPAELVAAPVRIADAAAVRLLSPGDRVDVIAARDGATGGGTSVVARGVRVTEVPEVPEATGGGGALVVLSVPRATAPRLVGAGTTAQLAVTLC
ncbi:hypothetical protein AB0L35_28905 [Streptomyces sp. NPDC052309]|uniref:hypothetical protein n=1 Tax=Streptomyces sp. NPDC052309 TaxID=3155421 RepID=UPI0034420771